MYSICRKLIGSIQKVNINELYLGTLLEGNADAEWNKRITAFKKLCGTNFLDLCDTFGKDRTYSLYSKSGQFEMRTSHGIIIVPCKRLIPYNYPVHYIEELDSMDLHLSESDVDNKGRVTLAQVYEAVEKEKQKVLNGKSNFKI